LFCERSLLQEVGLFDNRYQCAMDYHLWLRFTQLCEPKQFDFAIADFLLGGRSGDMKLAMKEEFLARREVLKQSLLEQFVSLTVVTLRYIKRKLKITTFVNKSVS
ncbi:MAG: glycosyltransferase family 2 protein, partial [Microcystaceae cyanobacterium]